MGGPIYIFRSAIVVLLWAVLLPCSSLFAKSKSLEEVSPWRSIEPPGETLSTYRVATSSSSLAKVYSRIPAGKEEQYFELGCLVSNFSGYFDPSRWVSCTLSGDSGVDVTGAPIPMLLVEGTSSDLIEVANEHCEEFSVIIPANGYISFEWDLLGSSVSQHPTATTFFSFFINNEEKALPASKKNYIAPYLKKGDRITFKLNRQNQSQVLIRNFEFMSNAMGVFERSWFTDTHQQGHQLIPIENTSITDLVIPSIVEITIENSEDLERLTQPYLIGQPYLDQDGDESTLDDQINLLEVETSLDLSWVDHITYDDSGNVLIVREWSIYDGCAGNEIHKQQLIHCRPK